MNKHTAEPWQWLDFGAWGDQVIYGPDAKERPIATAYAERGKRLIARANAQRIVACVNACKGVPTAILEASTALTFPAIPYLELETQADQLRTENARLRDALERIGQRWLALEMPPEFVAHADWQTGYEDSVRTARVALRGGHE